MRLAAYASVQIGEIVGRYRVVDRIGRGGMATVYEGEHTALRHRVAIKVLHPQHSANPRMRMRLFNEARAVAAIRHPGIVALFDIGRTRDGRTYVVLELLEGESLHVRLERDGAMPVESAVRFARQIAAAATAAHARGIVHRDLKPQNIFLVPDSDVDGGERVKVLDFGIAKRTAGTPLPEITATGVALGTPAYMSPEQCRGDESIDHRADIYSFGVVLYQMVSGRVPFADASTNEQLDRHQFARPPAAPCDVPAVTEVISRCLAKDPEKRFASMDDVVDALDATTQPPTSTFVEPVAPRSPRWRKLAGFGAAAVAVAVLSLVLVGRGDRVAASELATRVVVVPAPGLATQLDHPSLPPRSLTPAPVVDAPAGVPATPAFAPRPAAVTLVRNAPAPKPRPTRRRRAVAHKRPRRAPAAVQKSQRPQVQPTTVVERSPNKQAAATKERSFGTVKVPVLY